MMCSHCGATKDRWFIAVENGTICGPCLTRAMSEVMQQVSVALVFRQRITAAITALANGADPMAVSAILDPPAPVDETPA